MAQNEYKPVSFNGEPLSNAKLNQMANNTQFVYERMPKIRYATAGLTRETQLKVISGKTPYAADTTKEWVYLNIYFGTFFTAGCKPIVVATVEGGDHRANVVVLSLSRVGEIDHNGFIGVVSHYNKLLGLPNTLRAGWVHWTATGY